MAREGTEIVGTKENRLYYISKAKVDPRIIRSRGIHNPFMPKGERLNNRTVTAIYDASCSALALVGGRVGCRVQ